MEGMITLTKKEQRTNDIIFKLINKEIKIIDACRLLGLTERQVYRKKKDYILNGISSIPHKNRNKPTGKGYSIKLKKKIIYLYKTEYLGWNFYHFNDFLEDFHNISVSDSFVYRLLTSQGYESPNKYKKSKKESHPPRERRINAGELIQVDASKHDWLSNGSYLHLHGGIDDATNTVTGAYFMKEETIYGYQMIMFQTCKNYGIPECLYSDYRTVFQSTKQELTLEEELDGKTIENTRFANMLKHIGSDVISTRNPRAKGRVERLWRTFQDRLLKELKKYNITTIEKANEYLTNVFIPKYNARFAFPIDDNKNSFVSLDESFDFNSELAVWSYYSVHKNCYLRFDKKYHIILDNDEHAYIDTKQKVKVYTFLDGSINVLFNDKFYNTKQLDVLDKQQIMNKLASSVVKNKVDWSENGRLNSQNSPWRKSLPPVPNQKTLQWAYFNAY